MDPYHDINNLLNFHYSTMHTLSNMSSNTIKRAFGEKEKDKVIDIKICDYVEEIISLNDVSLEDALIRRRTDWPQRSKMNFRELASLLVHSFGVSEVTRYGNYDVYKKRYPSAGAEYSVKVYFYSQNVDSILDNRIFEYNIKKNGFVKIGDSSINQINSICSTSRFSERNFNNTNMLIFFVADFNKLFDKYGLLTYRLSLLEAGHMCQNAQLVSSALGFKSVPLGGFYDHNMERILNLKGREYCLYVLGVGR